MSFPAFDRLPLALRFGLYALASAILLYMCLAPSKALPNVHLWDKAEHAIAWAVLAGVGLMLFPTEAVAVAIFALGFGIAVEVLQGALPFGRDADWKDWLADCVGVAAALLVWAAIRRLKP
jgi:VanZ family protein